MKILTAVLLLCLCLPAVTWAESPPRVETLKVGKSSFYFRGVKSTAIQGLGSVLDDYRNRKMVVFLCANGDYKHLAEVMAFLEQRGITDITLRSAANAADC